MRSVLLSPFYRLKKKKAQGSHVTDKWRSWDLKPRYSGPKPKVFRLFDVSFSVTMTSKALLCECSGTLGKAVSLLDGMT